MGRLTNLFNQSIVIDLGTSHTRMSGDKDSFQIEAPSVLLLDQSSNAVVVGRAAADLIDRTPRRFTINQPITSGSIADFEATEVLLRQIIQSAGLKVSWWRRPAALITVLPNLSSVEQRAAVEVVSALGFQRIAVVDQLIAGAVGAGVAVRKTKGHIVVDIGGGATKLACIVRGKVIFAKSLASGGGELTEAIRQAIQSEFGLQLGRSTAEEIKHKLAAGHANQPNQKVWVVGKDILTHLPKRVRLNSDQLLDVVAKQLRPTVELIRSSFDEIPVHLRSHFRQQGVLLLGGGAYLRGFDAFLNEELKVPVNIATNAETAVIEGASRLWQNRRLYDEQIKVVNRAWVLPQ